MTWTVVTKYIRPNTDTDWYAAGGSSDSPMSDSDAAYVKSNYVDNGKRVSSTSSVSDDNLELTKTFVYRDKAAYEEYYEDSRVAAFASAAGTYNRSNNIDITRSSTAT